MALDLLSGTEVDLIISDMRMPGMSGADLLARAQQLYPETMRLLLTGYADLDAVVRAVNEGGVYRYLNKPWDDGDLLLTVSQALEQRRLRLEARRLTDLTRTQNDELRRFSAGLESQVAARTEEIRQTVMFLEEAQADLKRNFTSMIQICANMIELRCGGPAGQSLRVAEIARRLAFACGMDEPQALDVYHAGLLHGIGKLSLPDDLLRKTLDQMSADETRVFHQHPLRAQMVLMPVPRLNAVASIVLHQYERFNGRGTPDALAGKDIPLGSLIVAVARDFDGLRHGDIARRPLSREQAIDVIGRQAGARYDPGVVERFVALMKHPGSLDAEAATREVNSAQLASGMRLADDLRTDRGVLLMTRDSVISAHQIELIRSFEVREDTRLSITVHTDLAVAANAAGIHEDRA
jgi:response regulator RpfG family c-di-GMP phosphodiesterase